MVIPFSQDIQSIILKVITHPTNNVWHIFVCNPNIILLCFANIYNNKSLTILIIKYSKYKATFYCQPGSLYIRTHFVPENVLERGIDRIIIISRVNGGIHVMRSYIHT